MSNAVKSVLENAPNDLVRACLLASFSKESGAWLHALPISSSGLRMDDNTITVAVGLYLGSTLCHPHSCQHSGAKVNHLFTDSFSCKKSKGCHYRHIAVNDILYRTLASAHIPSRLEPSDLNCLDGKRKEGITMIPWKNGKPLVWDTTCMDMFAPSYRCHAQHRSRHDSKQALHKFHSMDPIIESIVPDIAPNWAIAMLDTCFSEEWLLTPGTSYSSQVPL